MKNLSNNFEIDNYVSNLFIGTRIYLHQTQKDKYFIEKRYLKEIVIEKDVYLN